MHLYLKVAHWNIAFIETLVGRMRIIFVMDIICRASDGSFVLSPQI